MKSPLDKILVIIPARGGSKGILGKNIKLLNGKPLINYTLEVASRLFEKEIIHVSTDDEKIQQTVIGFGIPVPELRPIELAQDTSSSRDVILNVIKKSNNNGYFPETIVLLQPTSPFRTTKQLLEALEMFNSDLDMVVSVKQSHSNPYYNLFEENDEGYLEKSKKGNFKGRQELPAVYEYNGAIYIIKVSSIQKSEISEFKNIKKYVMPTNNSVDLDEPIDWEYAEFLIQKKIIEFT